MFVSSVPRAAARFAACVVQAILFLAFTGGGVACSGQTPADDSATYDLHRHYKPGEVERHKAVVTTTTNGPQTNGRDEAVKYTLVTRKTIKSMTPDGAITIVMDFEQATGDVKGKILDVTAKMPRITQILDAQGNLRTTKEGGNDPLSMTMIKVLAGVEIAEGAGQPSMPIKMGATWKLTPPDPLPRDTVWSGAAGLMSLETISDFPTAKVNYKSDSSSNGASPAKTHTDASLYLDIATGKTVQLYCRMNAWTGDIKTTVDIQYNCLDKAPVAAASLKRTFKVGDVDRFMLYSVTTVSGPQSGAKDHIVKYEFIIRETVKSVDPDGSATLIDEFERARNSVDDMDIVDITSMMPKITISRDTKGGFRANSQGGDARFSKETLQTITQSIRMQNNAVPPQPVRVGDTWKFTGTDGGSDTAGTIKVESRESANGITALKLKCVTDTPGDAAAAKIHGEVTSFVDVTTGKTVNLTARLISSLGENKTTSEITLSPMGEEATGTQRGK